MARPSATCGVSRRRAHAALPHLSCRCAGTARPVNPPIADVGVPNTIGACARDIVGPGSVSIIPHPVIHRSLTHRDSPLRRLNRWPGLGPSGPAICRQARVWGAREPRRRHAPRAHDAIYERRPQHQPPNRNDASPATGCARDRSNGLLSPSSLACLDDPRIARRESRRGGGGRGVRCRSRHGIVSSMAVRFN